MYLQDSVRRMVVRRCAAATFVVWAAGSVQTAQGQAIGLTELSKESVACVDCHKKESPSIYQTWGMSKHFRGNVGCFECHAAEEGDVDAYTHYDQLIAVVVTPRDCARCHEREVKEFIGSHHAKAGRIIGSQDNLLAEVVEGNRAMVTPGLPEGTAASAVMGCWQCHGSQVKVFDKDMPGGYKKGMVDPATWPNTGIGRLNPDGSEGACSACHQRHAFSVALARHPSNCGRCHIGPDHPQGEIYEESKHGIAFAANTDKMNLDSPKWVLSEDYWVAPTCATCHMSATKTQRVSHDIGLRISWNNRPEVSVRPEVADAKMDLPGKDVPWQVRREKMQDVCLNCHNLNWINNFYTQYDALIELYNEKFGKPGRELYALAKPLREVEVPFANAVDWYWWELWHHEGRRARHGASMMGPDYTHWHGTYDVAKTFYTHYVPELRTLVKDGLASSDPSKVEQAEKLKAKLDQVLQSDNHKWVLGKMDPAEAARRKQAAEAFKRRYDN